MILSPTDGPIPIFYENEKVYLKADVFHQQM